MLQSAEGNQYLKQETKRLKSIKSNLTSNNPTYDTRFYPKTSANPNPSPSTDANPNPYSDPQLSPSANPNPNLDPMIDFIEYSYNVFHIQDKPGILITELPYFIQFCISSLLLKPNKSFGEGVSVLKDLVGEDSRVLVDGVGDLGVGRGVGMVEDGAGGEGGDIGAGNSEVLVGRGGSLENILVEGFVVGGVGDGVDARLNQKLIENSSHPLIPNTLPSQPAANDSTSRGLLEACSRGLIGKSSLCWVTLEQIIDLIIRMFKPPDRNLLYLMKQFINRIFYGRKKDAVAGLNSRYV